MERLGFILIYITISMPLLGQGIQNSLDSVMKVESKILPTYSNYTSFFQNKGYADKGAMKFIMKYVDEDSLINLQRVGYDLLYSLATNSESSSFKSLVLLELIKRSRYPLNNPHLIFRGFKYEDFSANAKAELERVTFELLSSKELDHIISKSSINKDNLEKQARSLSDGNPENYSKKVDSLVEVDLNKRRNDLLNNYCPESIFILGVGWLGIRTSIPKLHEILNNNNCTRINENLVRSLKYSLFKLGDNTYQDEILKEKFIMVEYLATVQSLLAFLRNNSSIEQNVYRSAVAKRNGKAVSELYLAILRIQDLVTNYPEKFKVKIVHTEDSEKSARQGYEWIKDNKDSLILDQNSWMH